MILQNEIETHVKSLLEEFLTNNITLAELTRAYHTDLYYNNDQYNDIDITILSLTGDIQTDVIQHPIQIMIDCSAEYRDELMQVLLKLAVSNNEALVTVGETKTRQFFKTPVVTSKFQKSGIKDMISISLDCSFFEFEDLLNVDKITLDDEEIKFTLLAETYTASTHSTGGLGDSAMNFKNQNAANTFQLQYIPKTSTLNKKIMSQALSCTNVNNTYTLKLYLDYETFTFNCILTSQSLTKELSAFPVMQITLQKKGD